MAMVAALCLPSPARAADVTTQVQALEQARAICATAAPGDRAAADKALSVLHGSPGQSQPELAAYLTATPPDFKSAAARIDELTSAIRHPISTQDPARADKDLKAILAQPRYLTSGPSIVERALAWLLEQLARLLGLLHLGNGAAAQAQLVELALAAVVVAVAVAFMVRVLSGRIRASRDTSPRRLSRLPAHDWFAQADGLAATDDYPAALRALTTAVATRVGGAGAWDQSPLTVRELFGKASLLPQLRPLLLPFEASVYGHRQPDAAIYAGALAVARPFRAPPSAEEAA